MGNRDFNTQYNFYLKQTHFTQLNVKLKFITTDKSLKSQFFQNLL